MSGFIGEIPKKITRGWINILDKDNIEMIDTKIEYEDSYNVVDGFSQSSFEILWTGTIDGMSYIASIGHVYSRIDTSTGDMVAYFEYSPDSIMLEFLEVSELYFKYNDDDEYFVLRDSGTLEFPNKSSIKIGTNSNIYKKVKVPHEVEYIHPHFGTKRKSIKKAWVGNANNEPELALYSEDYHVYNKDLLYFTPGQIFIYQEKLNIVHNNNGVMEHESINTLDNLVLESNSIFTNLSDPYAWLDGNEKTFVFLLVNNNNIYMYKNCDEQDINNECFYTIISESGAILHNAQHIKIADSISRNINNLWGSFALLNNKFHFLFNAISYDPWDQYQITEDSYFLPGKVYYELVIYGDAETFERTTDIVMDPSKTYYEYYEVIDYPEHVFHYSSTDGINWNKEIEHFVDVGYYVQYNYGFTLIHNNKLNFFIKNLHFIYDEEHHIWSMNDELPITLDIMDNIISYNNTIFIYTHDKKIYKYNNGNLIYVGDSLNKFYYVKVYNNKIYGFDTYSSRYPTNPSKRYYTSNDGIIFYEEFGLPSNVYRNEAVIYNDKIHIINSEPVHYSFDDRWVYESYPGNYMNNDSLGMVVFNGQIHLLGISSDFNRHAFWNGVNWTNISTRLPYKFCDGSAVVYDDKIHILGGNTVAVALNHYSYDGSSWTKETDLNEDYGVKLHSCVVFNNKIYLLGGADINSNYPSKGTYWDEDNDRWVPFDMPYCIVAGAAVVYHDKIHIFGGSYGNTGRNHYSYDGNKWMKELDLPYNFSHGSAVVYDDEIYLLGGQNSQYTRLVTNLNHYFS